MTPSAEVRLTILGSHFRVVSEDELMVELVRELWEPFVVHGDGPRPLEVEIGVRGPSWHLLMPGEPRVSAQDPWLLASSLRNALSRRAINQATSIIPLHAAAVERDGVVLVLPGPPRAGKTTLLLELLDRGWLLVTDDLVPLDPRTLTAAPFPKPLSIREPDRWKRFAPGWHVPEWMPPPVTAGLLPATAFRLSGASSYSPSLLVFPRFVAGVEPAQERLTAAETVAWAGDNLHSRGPGAPGVLPALARLGSSTPGYALRYGSTDTALELLAKCLADPGVME